MVSKSPKGPAGTVRQSGEPRLKRSSAEMRDATGSNYDRFWQCMFGWQAAERRPETGDVPLPRHAWAPLGMAEESQPLDLGNKRGARKAARQRGTAEHCAPGISPPRRSNTEKK